MAFTYSLQIHKEIWDELHNQLLTIAKGLDYSINRDRNHHLYRIVMFTKNGLGGAEGI